MYKQHKVFVSPDDPNAKIWRYFDFTKFVSLLDKQALFFVRADKLEDKFEGALTKKNVELRKIRSETFKFSDNYDDLDKYLRKYIVINSWHQNDQESAAMWKLYLKSDEGIAIQSTFKRFCNSFADYAEDDVLIGTVKYTDYENEIIPENNLFHPFLHKRKSFEHEKEIRGLIMRFPDSDPIDKKVNWSIDKFDSGLYVDCNLTTLIEKIYVSPYASEWFFELVKSIAKKYAVDVEVMASDLKKPPYTFY